MDDNEVNLETLVSLAKRRGFVFRSSEMYGGIAGFWDYGPYGVELMNNLKASWWQFFVREQPDVVGIDGAIIQSPKLWKASGHIDGFNDPLVEDLVTHKRYRADHLAGVDTNDIDKLNELLKDKKSPDGNLLGPVRTFNMMFKTFVGALEDEDSVAYLRPETAGAIFANYKNVLDTARVKVPFGIGQIGKAFRNEISPRDFIFRVRELEQFEIEYFVPAEQSSETLERYKKLYDEWFDTLGLDKNKLAWRRLEPDERAHYSADNWDIEYKYFGDKPKELGGISNRTDYDLSHHAEASGKDLRYFDPEKGEHFLPNVIEPTLGAGRLLLAVMDSAYHEEEVNGEKRVVLKFKPSIAPVKVAILPLSKKPELSALARKMYNDLVRSAGYNIEYDETQSIGKRYRRQDEIGTPYCVTVDFESLEDGQVTVRNRDTMEQKRVKIEELRSVLEGL
jgi:glycyl-tRNA synthetase